MRISLRISSEARADILRWTYARCNPTNNLLFGYTVAGEVRRRLLTLWNVYSFFVTYARLDGFDPTRAALADLELGQLDRWILAKLNRLIREVRASLDDFDSMTAARDVEAFVDELSTWYLRRGRRRYWKSEADADKTAAYATLHHVLVTLFSVVGLIAIAALMAATIRLRPDTTGVSSGVSGFGRTLRGLRDALTLRHLHPAGVDCTEAIESRHPWRRWLHHCTSYGFALCFASTSVAAVYHLVFGWLAPYPYTSLPVVLGTIGGIGLTIGPAGLLVGSDGTHVGHRTPSARFGLFPLVAA